MIRFLKARAGDAEALARASKRAFDSDVVCGAQGPGGPPGYDSAEWQRKIMRMAQYFKIVQDGRIVGGVIVFAQGPRHYELGRIFVDPDAQNQGIGAQAFEFLWQEYPLAKKWTLGTPAWNRRTRHFYAKVGFVEVGMDGPDGIRFEKIISMGGEHEHS
ncbi:MAG: GNAT family N-acetyltransferase, partial [Chloroflexi bacterium]|nr:GNAT family N-acetyltransferase [Chloroflexota bacterium]MBU1749005.1 GNAT family N-acetyltransferase [Chloroflexota bacterium]MBU1877927.1 GNAT family N-acetyltransferase [Chloroflexota bacterium]